MARPIHTIHIITKEEFDKLQTRCGCGCEELFEWREWYRRKGIPKYKRGHETRIINPAKLIETKRKISIAKKGKNHHFYGKHLTESHKNKLSESHKGENNGFYGKHHTEETKEYLSVIQIGKKQSEGCKLKKSLAMSKENHWNWQNGKSYEPYCEKFNKKLKDEIRKLYDYTCFLCNTKEGNKLTKTGKVRKHSIHHVDYDKEQGCNGKKWELILLCVSCNSKVNFNREYWNKYFIDMLKFYKIKNFWRIFKL